MGRRGFLAAMAAAQREAQRRERAHARDLARADRAYERAMRAAAKEQATAYRASREEEAEARTLELAQRVAELTGILAATLEVDDFVDLDELKEPLVVPEFAPGSLALHRPDSGPFSIVLSEFASKGTDRPEPPPEFIEPKISFLARLLPGAAKRREAAARRAAAEHERLVQEWTAREALRREAYAKHKREYEMAVAAEKERIAKQHAEVEVFKEALARGSPDAIRAYFAVVLERSRYPEDFPREYKLAYVPESRQLVVEYRLPAFDVVPAESACRYVKARDEVVSTKRSMVERRAIYSLAIAQIVIRTLHEIFEADRSRFVDTIVLNGFVETVDPATGRVVRPHLVTVRTSLDTFADLDLAKVDAQACLRHLSASVSKSPAELAPVKPILEFDMVDPRFVEETDVLSTLDARPNLMDLTPTEFEALITNLFEKMGLETRMTQASRDGGVDCVAYDPRPIFGGKVVIQAKRYKNTVGVSAVRDLFGTMQNEGASKGILVTTSGYGKAAFEFAEGKPIELLSGSHLLYLLEEHAGVKARIVMPEGPDPA